MTELTHTALIPLPAERTEIALPDALIERAKDYAAQALAERSRAAYQRWWCRFQAWADNHGRQALPASPATLAAWIVDLADGTSTGRPLAKSSINQAVAGVIWVHRNAGHSVDRKNRAISLVWAGVSRTKNMTQSVRRVAPFMIDDLADLLGILNLRRNIGCRDAALFTLGFSAALRRSELTGLDWHELGTGTGFVRIEEKGIVVTLCRSKASQDAPVEIAIPRADRPEAIKALERWVERAQIQPKAALLRGVDNRNRISDYRLTAHSVARICKAGMRKLSRKRGYTIEEAQANARRYSGHSLRAGLVSSAAAANVPALKIAQLSRHASLEMVMLYVRQVEQFTESPHKSIRPTQKPMPRSGEAQPGCPGPAGLE
jgi:integrase